MVKITKDMTLGQLREAMPEFARWFRVDKGAPFEYPDDFVLADDNGGAEGNGEYICEAFEFMQKCLEEGYPVIRNIYTDEEIAADPSKGNTSLIFFPGRPGAPFVYGISGGAYMAVCNLSEAFACCYHLSQLGYNSFAITYRVNEEKIIDRSLEDLAAGIRYIFAHKDEYKVDTEGYATMGFSAGGHLTALWCQKNKGARSFGLPAPIVGMPVYPSFSTMDFYDRIGAGLGSEGYRYIGNLALEKLVGKNYTKELLAPYSAELNLDPEYPAIYAVQDTGDEDVSITGMYRFKEAIDKTDIPHIIRIDEGGRHGFGLGFGTPSYGWLDEAVEFWEKIRAEK